MKMMYGAMEGGEVIAYHKKKKVILTYARNYHITNPLHTISIVIIPFEEAIMDIHFEDYYLTACNETYIQQKYEDVLLLDSNYEEKVYLLNQLESILLHTKRKKHRKALIETMKIVEINKRRCGIYTPSLSELNTRFWEYEKFRNVMFYD